MTHWQFMSILHTANVESQIKSGKPVVRKKLYKSQKDMIARTKELMK